MEQAKDPRDILNELRASLRSSIDNLRSNVLGAAAVIHAKVNGKSTHTTPTIQDVIDSLREPDVWEFKNAGTCETGISSAPFVAANMLEKILEGEINGRDPQATFANDHDDEAVVECGRFLRQIGLYDAAAAPGDLHENLERAMKKQVAAQSGTVAGRLAEHLQKLSGKPNAKHDAEQVNDVASAAERSEDVFTHGPIELAIACARFTQAAGIDTFSMSDKDRGQLMKGVDAILGAVPAPGDDDELPQGDRNLLSLNRRIPLTKLIAALVVRQGGKVKLSHSEVDDIADASGLAIGSDGKSMSIIVGDISDRSQADLIHELQTL